MAFCELSQIGHKYLPAGFCHCTVGNFDISLLTSPFDIYIVQLCECRMDLTVQVQACQPGHVKIWGKV